MVGMYKQYLSEVEMTSNFLVSTGMEMVKSLRFWLHILLVHGSIQWDYLDAANYTKTSIFSSTLYN